MVNAMYPHWFTYVSTIAEGVHQNEKRFERALEAVRKDVERALGVLISH